MVVTGLSRPAAPASTSALLNVISGGIRYNAMNSATTSDKRITDICWTSAQVTALMPPVVV